MNNYTPNLSQINTLYIYSAEKFKKPEQHNTPPSVQSHNNKSNKKIPLALAGLAVAGVAATLGVLHHKNTGAKGIKVLQNTAQVLNDKNSLEKLGNLCSKEKETLLQAIQKDNSANAFFSVINGQKPSALLLFKDASTASILDKLKDDKFDVLTIKSDCNEFKKVVLNKKLVSGIIDDNIELLRARLEMNLNAGSEEIYAKLVNKNGPLANDAFITRSGNTDIAGLILGYPKISSMIFELEQRANLAKTRVDIFSKNSIKLPEIINENENNLRNYKNGLINTLYADNSPYKMLGKDFLKNLERNINAIAEFKDAPNDIAKLGYSFVQYIKEPQELSRIRGYKRHAN